jgi:LuxR family maltose regulon positive regulatory protein
VLVLDDYHVIETAVIHDALTFLLSHVPPTLHLVIASRADPPLPLPRLRARGELTELRAADLRFTPEEAASFLTEVMGLPLSADDVAALETRTEGWIAGLQLAALAMRDRHDLTSFISAFTGSQRFVGEYLAEEVFNRQPAHIQTFLLQTSILSRMCASLCDAVLSDGAGGVAVQMPDPAVSGESFCQDVLEELERANLFVVPLDDARQWYRYHHLFGEMLRARLLRGGSEVALATLHRRASAWYEGQGLVVEAVQHALAAHEWEPAARLIKQHGIRLTMSGQVHTVLGWLEVLPTAVVQLSPTLCQIHALGLLFTYQFAAAEVWLRNAERALEAVTSAERVRRVRGELAEVWGAIRYFMGDLTQAIGLIQQALELLPAPTSSVTAGDAIARARAVAAVYAATVYHLTGDVTAASERYASAAIAPVRATGYLTETLNGYSYLAWLQVLQGRLRTAAATYTEIERLVPGPDALHALSGSPTYYFGMGDLWREWNELDAAEGYLARGMERVQGGLATHAGVILRGYLALARVQHARGHGEAALATLDAFIQLARERQFFELLIDQAAVRQARLQLLQGDLGAALRWAEASGLAPADEISFPREAAHLTLARVRIAAGQAAEVMPLLARLLADAESKARMHSAIEIRTLQALAYHSLGDRPRALAALGSALALAEPEGYVRTFVDEGAQMAALLQEAHTHDSMTDYVTKLLAAFGHFRFQIVDFRLKQEQSTIYNLQSAMVEPLSEREREVLDLVAAGLSNQEIAARLFVGVSTVKKHINNIFGKLAVRSRTQALARARELNLL